MSDTESPQFRVPNEGDPIPPVDPEDVKRVWNIKPGDRETLSAASQEANSEAISKRCWMIRVLNHSNEGQFLAPWKHGEELDDAVFRIAATFPIRPLVQHVYMLPGDSLSGFDPNAFVEKLIEETGIQHVWEPVLATISEGNWAYSTSSADSGSMTFPSPPDSEREMRHRISELLWAVWSKCHPKISRPSPNHVQYDVQVIAKWFAEFVIDNVILALDFVSPRNGTDRRDPLTILLELERKALSFFRRP